MHVICFMNQWMTRSKHGLFVFPPKKTLKWRRHCSIVDWPIVLQYDVKENYQLISRKFTGMKFFHPSVRFKSHVRLYSFDKPIKSLYFVRFLFLFCLRVFISRSYENRSKPLDGIHIVYQCVSFNLYTDRT